MVVRMLHDASYGHHDVKSHLARNSPIREKVCIYGMAQANAQPSNALIIFKELDARLKAPIRMVLFGRGTLALGFEPPSPKWTQTLDLDAIIPKQEEKEFEENNEFWAALDAVNAVLGQKELYFTHLFNEEQIILSEATIPKEGGLGFFSERGLFSLHAFS